MFDTVQTNNAMFDIEQSEDRTILFSCYAVVSHAGTDRCQGITSRNKITCSMRCRPRQRERLYPHLELVEMPLGKVLYESGDVLRHVYFPTDSIVSLLYVMEDGASAEISVVGNEGLIGVALFMGGETTPSRAIVQSAGYAYRLVGQRLKDEFHRNGEMQILLLRYTQALLTQMAQTAVCNRHHSVDQQLCRWLLLSLDRLSSNELTMTQELIANMLGVRREGVTEAAGKLQKLGCYPLQPRGRSRCSTGRSWNSSAASAMPWSRKKRIGCCRAELDSSRRAKQGTELARPPAIATRTARFLHIISDTCCTERSGHCSTDYAFGINSTAGVCDASNP